jgi:poly(3-hydroxybutyrate) depolymerase
MHFFSPDSSDFYSFVEAAKMNYSPIRSSLISAQNLFEDSCNPAYHNYFSALTRASLEMIERLTRDYKKPQFGITECEIDGKRQLVKKSILLKGPFCHLLHFAKLNYKEQQPKLLIVAPMSGHHATLLRETVRDTLPYFDVYITDWIDAKQVPITDGSFDLDDFIDYVITYIKFLGDKVHVLAVCQPTVPVLAATALMSEDSPSKVPKSVILIGGPIDARKNPTKPNNFATDKSLIWFDKALVTNVPENYPGHRRRVYPGFLQLTSFISMNLDRHINSHIELFHDLLNNNTAKAEKQKKFYNEYLSVMDLPAEFYLQTIKEVFHDFSLAKGTLISRGRKVNLDFINNTAIMGIEGENDDIAAVGQTKAALKLCKNVPDSKKYYHLQKAVGHYGSFSGSKFKDNIVPKIKEFVYANN